MKKDKKIKYATIDFETTKEAMQSLFIKGCVQILLENITLEDLKLQMFKGNDTLKQVIVAAMTLKGFKDEIKRHEEKTKKIKSRRKTTTRKRKKAI